MRRLEARRLRRLAAAFAHRAGVTARHQADPTVNNVEAFPGTPSDWFWTSSRAADDSNAAWYVYFYFGYPRTDDVTNAFSVRCVRTEQPPRAFSDPLRRASAGRAGRRDEYAVGALTTNQALTFEAARAYCSQLKLGGNQRWRVPTLAELLTLVDERASSPMIDRAAFPGTPADAFWTSSTFANGHELAWYVRFDRGSGLMGGWSNRFHVRCVL